MSAGALARVCGLPRRRIERTAGEQTGIGANTALRLAKALGTTAQLWLNLQNDCDSQIAQCSLARIRDRIETVNKPKAAWPARGLGRPSWRRWRAGPMNSAHRHRPGQRARLQKRLPLFTIAP
jgi:addiction module HigA family antidote